LYHDVATHAVTSVKSLLFEICIAGWVELLENLLHKVEIMCELMAEEAASVLGGVDVEEIVSRATLL
jgi:hypothetical protein